MMAGPADFPTTRWSLAAGAKRSRPAGLLPSAGILVRGLPVPAVRLRRFGPMQNAGASAPFRCRLLSTTGATKRIASARPARSP
jgi:hypothetical protein